MTRTRRSRILISTGCVLIVPRWLLIRPDLSRAQYTIIWRYSSNYSGEYTTSKIISATGAGNLTKTRQRHRVSVKRHLGRSARGVVRFAPFHDQARTFLDTNVRWLACASGFSRPGLILVIVRASSALIHCLASSVMRGGASYRFLSR